VVGVTDESPTSPPTAVDDETDLPLEPLTRLPDFYNPVLSPDGDRVAFQYDETGRVELYVQDLDTGERQQVSDGNVPRDARYPIAWSRDADRLYFHRDEGGDEQNDIYAIDLDGELDPLVATDGQCILQDVGPDGRYLLYSSTAGEQMNLYRYDLDADESEQLTSYDQPVRGARFGPGGDRVAYTTNETDDLQNLDVYVADADGSDSRKLPVGEQGTEVVLADWSDDRILLRDNSQDLGRVGVYELGEESVSWYGDGDADERPLGFTDDGRVATTRSRACAMVPVVYDSPDDGTELAVPEGVTSGLGYAGSPTCDADGRLLLTQSTADSREELLAYDLATDTTETVVEADYGEFDPDSFADAEYVTYESHDGLEIEGVLYDSGERPSPAVVMVHGGPHAETNRSFSPFLQYLVSRGYSVFAPNYRGSTGRGREFKNLIHHDWGGDEQGDIAAAGQWLKDRDWIDADRIGVFGGSYGGYSTYCQLTMYPDLWTTGIAIVGMTDLQLLYEESMPHFETALEQQLGDPDEAADLYRERSPITHIDSMTSPICMVHGVNDPRCPISQARVFRDALEDRGWTEGEDGDFEYHELDEEGHGSTDTEQRLRQYRILGDYLDRRL
jgi:dipeptidyl aminopeptidase/acylaminoacyl peptidase